MGSLRSLKSQDRLRVDPTEVVEEIIDSVRNTHSAPAQPAVYYSTNKSYHYFIRANRWDIQFSIKEDPRNLWDKLWKQPSRYRFLAEITPNTVIVGDEKIVYEHTVHKYDKGDLEMFMDDARMILVNKPEKWRSEFTFPKNWTLIRDPKGAVAKMFKDLMIP